MLGVRVSQVPVGFEPWTDRKKFGVKGVNFGQCLQTIEYL